MRGAPATAVMTTNITLFTIGLERLKIASLVPLLLIQFLLLVAFFALCRSAGPRLDPNTTIMILAGMLGVSAMAVQNGLARISLRWGQCKQHR
jgi:hypothetical protein